jgi:hypothetical protein
MSAKQRPSSLALRSDPFMPCYNLPAPCLVTNAKEKKQRITGKKKRGTEKIGVVDRRRVKPQLESIICELDLSCSESSTLRQWFSVILQWPFNR